MMLHKRSNKKVERKKNRLVKSIEILKCLFFVEASKALFFRLEEPKGHQNNIARGDIFRGWSSVSNISLCALCWLKQHVKIYRIVLGTFSFPPRRFLLDFLIFELEIFASLGRAREQQSSDRQPHFTTEFIASFDFTDLVSPPKLWTARRVMGSI